MNKPIKYGRVRNEQVTATANRNRSKDDFGYGGNERGNEADDRVNREAYGGQLAPRAAYASIVGEPVQLAPADFVGARAYLKRIETAMEHGGWTRNEWRKLHKLLAKWKLRADGNDARFNSVGNKQGGLEYTHARYVSTMNSIKSLRQMLDGGIPE